MAGCPSSIVGPFLVGQGVEPAKHIFPRPEKITDLRLIIFLEGAGMSMTLSNVTSIKNGTKKHLMC